MSDPTPFTPCLFDRRIVTKPWGARHLERVPGIELPVAGEVGETWEVYDRADGASAIRGSDETLRDWMVRDAAALLGRGVAPAAGGRFPLLLKFIDAAAPLSVQVHPDDRQAAAAGDSGKSEAWVILEAGDDACIRRGLRAGVTRAQFERQAATAEVLDLLETFAPVAGDVVYVPPGTVHAIGPGVVLFEVQQNSDITYRLYDWGRDREMHLSDGLRAVDFAAAPRTTETPVDCPDGGEWLIRDAHFRVRRQQVTAPEVLATRGTFKTLTVLEGSVTIGWHSRGEHAPLLARRGDTALVPACLESVFLSPIGRLLLLVCEPGEAS